MNRGAPVFAAQGFNMKLKPALPILVIAAACGCAGNPQQVSPGMSSTEVGAALGKPSAIGQLPGGEAYWDYSAQPFGFTNDRVTFNPDGRVRDVRNLLTEENFANLHKGMTPEEVRVLLGPSAPFEQRRFAGGTSSWTYRYKERSITKLLHVIFDSADRVEWHYTEWDPNVYSKGGGKSGGGR